MESGRMLCSSRREKTPIEKMETATKVRCCIEIEMKGNKNQSRLSSTNKISFNAALETDNLTIHIISNMFFPLTGRLYVGK